MKLCERDGEISDPQAGGLCRAGEVRYEQEDLEGSGDVARSLDDFDVGSQGAGREDRSTPARPSSMRR